MKCFFLYMFCLVMISCGRAQNEDFTNSKEFNEMVALKKQMAEIVISHMKLNSERHRKSSEPLKLAPGDSMAYSTLSRKYLLLFRELKVQNIEIYKMPDSVYQAKFIKAMQEKLHPKGFLNLKNMQK